MKAPDKIYVDIRHPFGNEFTEILGFESRGNSDDIEYIRKDALLEWLEQKENYAINGLVKKTYINVIDKLNWM